MTDSRPTVYIETTVPSYYFETRTSHNAIAWRNFTRDWWSQCRERCRLVTSDITFRELARAPDAKRLSAMKLLHGIEVLVATDEIDRLRDRYVELLVMPQEAEGDADHLAFASVYGIDYLLTWNCRHLANANKYRQIAVVNQRYGLRSPLIVTPLQLLGQ